MARLQGRLQLEILRMSIMLLIGLVSTATMARADVVLHWNKIAVKYGHHRSKSAFHQALLDIAHHAGSPCSRRCNVIKGSSSPISMPI